VRAACRGPPRISSVNGVALASPLRAHLQNVFPGAVGLFAGPDSPDRPTVSFVPL
jgi:hypothetical protein